MKMPTQQEVLDWLDKARQSPPHLPCNEYPTRQKLIIGSPVACLVSEMLRSMGLGNTMVFQVLVYPDTGCDPCDTTPTIAMLIKWFDSQQSKNGDRIIDAQKTYQLAYELLLHNMEVKEDGSKVPDHKRSVELVGATGE